MKKIIYIFFIVALVACGSKSDEKEATNKSEVVNLISFEDIDSEMFGYKDSLGNVVISPQYTIAYEFSEGTAFVLEKHTGWRLIDATGKPILAPFIFDNGPDSFKEGLARYIEHEKVGFYKLGGKKVTPAKYEFALPFSEGLAAVCEGCKKEAMGEHYRMAGGKWGYINHKGEIPIPLQYDEAESFEKNKAEVRKGSEWFVIDKNGVIQ
jgi:hypothetical protein